MTKKAETATTIRPQVTIMLKSLATSAEDLQGGVYSDPGSGYRLPVPKGFCGVPFHPINSEPTKPTNPGHVLVKIQAERSLDGGASGQTPVPIMTEKGSIVVFRDVWVELNLENAAILLTTVKKTYVQQNIYSAKKAIEGNVYSIMWGNHNFNTEEADAYFRQRHANTPEPMIYGANGNPLSAGMGAIQV